MDLNEYVASLNKRYSLGNATEHTYRGDLEHLIETIVPDITATNEPKRIKCGAPDYVLMRRDIPVGFIEAKDIGDKDLAGANKKGHKEQFDRYKAALNNLMFTDYLDFHLYIDGEFVTQVAIAEVRDGQIVPLPENFASFTNLLTDFCVHVSQTIKSSKKLAEMMAGKARMLSDVIGKALLSDEESSENSELREQLESFRQILIHDISPTGFADVYAQTIAYGLFAARLHDPDLPTFSRDEAARLIPKSNPFLRRLFGYIAGANLDDRISWIVDNLVEIFLACNVEELLGVGNTGMQVNDPIIHFYETFLSEYDPKLRKARGVWYTPQPVVSFIVRSVDSLLKSEFGLVAGLADSSKTKMTIRQQTSDGRSKSGAKDVEREVHRVQILDPAAGTGTFLAESVRHIYKRFEGQEGIWSSYVANDLIPRLNGFELLMASYAIAHLKLDLLFSESGYTSEDDQRFRIYLTNSLEESHPDIDTIFASWLSAEANEANFVKRDTPIMCVLGNPPYSGESSNKGSWITSLMEDYKKEPGGLEKLKEKNSKFLNDDYVKFLRYAQHYVEKNESGIVAFINPHGYLDNNTFRGMRWNLMKTYDQIFTIDLHGNTKKKEKAPDGSVDENVFDIQQGVSINFFVKTGKKAKGELGKVFHYELYGKRDSKYDFLNSNELDQIDFQELQPSSPDFFFTNKTFEGREEYMSGFQLPDLFLTNSLGILTKRDVLSTAFTAEDLKQKLEYFLDADRTTEEACSKFGLKIKDNDKWDAAAVRSSRTLEDAVLAIREVEYRPFDRRMVCYDPLLVARLNGRVLSNLNEDSVGLIVGRSGQAVGADEWNLAFVCDGLVDQNIYRRGGGTVFPLFVSNQDQQLFGEGEAEKEPNFNKEIIDKIQASLGLDFVLDRGDLFNCFSPVDVFDYVYAKLYSPRFREKYSEFLQVDFPYIPYPNDVDMFWALVEKGAALRRLHLLKSDSLEDALTKYPKSGHNVVEKSECKDNRVWINEDQYFDGVTNEDWKFMAGGYQPAQKWLKDRMGRTLTVDEVFHYQRMISSISKTRSVMDEIEKIDIY